MYVFRNNYWYKEKDYPKNPHPLIQLSLSQDESFVIGTLRTGFLLWNIAAVNERDTQCTSLLLPPGIRNVATKMNKAMPCVLSDQQKYAVTGIRKELYIWSVETGELVKFLDAHFARIVDIKPLIIGTWNCVVTSSIDRTVKVWNLDYMFEQVHHIPRHELPIESISLPSDAGIAAVVTRNCVGIWDLLTGNLNYNLPRCTYSRI